MERSNKNYVFTLLACFFLGTLGLHRLYAGKTQTAILMFLTLGGLGLWWVIDLTLTVLMRFKDKQGHLIQP